MAYHVMFWHVYILYNIQVRVNIPFPQTFIIFYGKSIRKILGVVLKC